MLEQRNVVKGLPEQYRDPGYAVKASSTRAASNAKKQNKFQVRTTKQSEQRRILFRVRIRTPAKFCGWKCLPSDSNCYMSVPLRCKIF